MAEAHVVHALTHPGAVRPANEDSVAVGPWVSANALTRAKRFEHPADRPLLAAVADGMGGHPGGATASYLVVTHLQRHAAAVASTADAARLLESANAALYEMMESGDGPRGMGTTLAAVAVRPEAVIACNVGDSKVYRAAADGLVQLSTDDTPGPKLADGRTSATTTPMLTQSLGGQLSPTEIEPHAIKEPPAPGTRYLLCSDGLSDLVASAEMHAVLTRHRDDDAATVETLFQAAMDAGGRDNISIVLLRLAGEAAGAGGAA